MSDSLAATEVHRLVKELEEMRLRAEAAEARIASVSGVTREELVRNEREACVRLILVGFQDGTTSVDDVVAAIRARGVR